MRYHLAPRTFLDYSNYIKTLSGFFAAVTLPQIDGDMMRAYQHARMQSAGPGLVNKECSIILMVRERMGMPLADYRRLRMPKDYESPGRALSSPEEACWERICRAAADHPLWDAAALGSLFSMKTGCGPGEILCLKLQDITIDQPSYIIIPPRGAKRVSRQRKVVLNDGAEWAIRKLIERAIKKCGAAQPEHFLFPRRERDHSWNPERPMQTYREALTQLQHLAGTEFRPYDLRHHAISRALSNPKVSLAAASLHFGHISSKMKQRYYHGDTETLRVVAAAIDSRPVENSLDRDAVIRKYLKMT